MRVIGYTRVSTNEQADQGVSLEAQKEKIKAWCVLNDCELLAVYTDAGISGSNSNNRPGLTEAIEAACWYKGEIALVVYSLTRLTRSTRDAITIAERLNKSGADLVSLSENIDTTTAAGKMVYRMLAVLAEFERDQISERTRTAMQHLKNNNFYTGGNAPYGYQVSPSGQLIAVKSEQKIISLVRTLSLASLTYSAIANKLNSSGFRSRNKTAFQAVQIRNILLKNQEQAKG